MKCPCVGWCRRERLSTFKLVRDVYRLHGVRGFYRGVTASYYGSAETMIYFVLYERLRLSIGHWRGMTMDEDRRMFDFLVFMLASAVCKSTACCLAYPHGQSVKRKCRLIDRLYTILSLYMQYIAKAD